MSDQAGPNAPPLDGLKVVDFSRVIAGPLCTMHLADFGADVVKIENPDGGDDSRGMRPPTYGEESAFYIAFNRSKKGIALDLRQPEGIAVARDLIAWADVLVENFRPGVMRRFGLDYDSLKDAFPELIYLSVSAYGQTGDDADRPGFDPVLQAESGMMAITGEADGPPLRHPLSIIDTFTGIHATAAVTTALLAKARTGRGQHIDLALKDAAIAALGNAALSYLASGAAPPRVGNAHPAAIPTNLFETTTGPIYTALGTNRLFGQLCRDVIDRPELATDPRFRDPQDRARHRDELLGLLQEIFATEPREHWLARMRHLPAGPVNSLGEALEDAAASPRGMVRTIDHPTAGPIRTLGSMYRFSDTPVREPEAPPLLGQHTVEVLQGRLGYDRARVDALLASGAAAQATLP